MSKYILKEIIVQSGGVVEDELSWHTWRVNTYNGIKAIHDLATENNTKKVRDKNGEISVRMG